eukprot:7228726-Prymnesium_polylepis.1
MLQHPAARALVHKPLDSSSGGGDAPSAQQPAVQRPNGTPDVLTAAAAADPFDPTEAEPDQCRALDSSLWEVDALRSHFLPTVSAVAALFAK